MTVQKRAGAAKILSSATDLCISIKLTLIEIKCKAGLVNVVEK